MTEVVEKKEKVELPKKAKVAKIIAIVIFSTVVACLVLALVTDIAIFSNQILAFIGGCLGAIGAFIIGIVFLFFSIVLIFGVYLLEQQGFWPLTWASNAFHSAIADAPITAGQLEALVAIRIVIIVLCTICFGCSIAVLALAKKAKKENPDIKQGLSRTFGILTLIFSILGIFAALTLILLLSLAK